MTFDKRLTSLLPEDACGEVKLIALNRKIESALEHHFIDDAGIRICEVGAICRGSSIGRARGFM